jgi:hypothetical protein
MFDSIDEITDRISADPLFGHRLLFSDRPHLVSEAPFHKELLTLYHSDHERIVALAFRGGGKSTLAERCLLIGALTKQFSYGVIVCATVDRAVDRLRSIKAQIENNDDVVEIFESQVGTPWQETRIVLANGVCLDAVGARQSTRGLKYLTSRPDFVLIDDLEEMSRDLDNVSTPERRAEISEWFYGVLIPALARRHKIRLCGTMLHEESLIGLASRSPDWQSLKVPIEYLDSDGNRVAAWPDMFDLEWIDRERARCERAGQLVTFEREYLGVAASPQSRAFREEHFRFEDRRHTWEPCYIIYDPARTSVPGKSCATGMVAASWVGGKLLVWEATQAFWSPSQVIDSIFQKNAEYAPIEIGFEETGLSQWAMQPLRQAQITRGSIPLRALNPPRGPGKENFLLRLEPFFAAGEVIFMGPRTKFKKLIEELLGFPYGLVDTVNALAYMLEIKPGEAIYPGFMSEHVIDAVPTSVVNYGQKHLLLDSDGKHTVAILISIHKERTYVIAIGASRQLPVSSYRVLRVPLAFLPAALSRFMRSRIISATTTRSALPPRQGPLASMPCVVAILRPGARSCGP